MTQTVILSSALARSKAMRIIHAAPDGSVMKVSAPRRSSDANAKMWALLSDVSRAKPEGRDYPPEIWKCLFMASVGHQVRWEPGLDEGVVNVGFRSSRLSKDEMSDLIEAIYAYGAKHGVVWTEGGR
jgi:hypothetical protein